MFLLSFSSPPLFPFSSCFFAVPVISSRRKTKVQGTKKRDKNKNKKKAPTLPEQTNKQTNKQTKELTLPLISLHLFVCLRIKKRGRGGNEGNQKEKKRKGNPIV